VLAGCSAAPKPPHSACPLPSEQTLAQIEIFFGRDIPGRAPLTEAEWSDFVARVITAQFPDGFTVFDGQGQWLDQGTGRTIREPSKILLAAADPDSDLAGRIGAVTDAYRKEFHQQSVGVMTSTACGAF
jgi:hypothetical protein